MFEIIEQRIVALVAGTAAAARRAGAAFCNRETVAASAVIGVTGLLLAAILVPVFSTTHCHSSSYYRERRFCEGRWERRHCGGHRSSRANVERLATALLQYAQDNDGRLPPMNDAATARAALSPYVRDERAWYHPWTGEPFEPNPILSHRKLGQIANPEEFVAFFAPRPGWKGTRAVGFLDGNAYRIPEEQWPELKRASRIAWDW